MLSKKEISKALTVAAKVLGRAGGKVCRKNCSRAYMRVIARKAADTRWLRYHEGAAKIVLVAAQVNGNAPPRDDDANDLPTPPPPITP